MKYEYTHNIFDILFTSDDNKILKDISEASNDKFSYNKHMLNPFIDDVKDRMYFVDVNSTDTFLCLYNSTEDITYFSLYENTLECIQKNRSRYKEILKGYNQITKHFNDIMNYDGFIKQLNHYDIEDNQKNNNVIFIDSGMIFNNEKLEFSLQNDKLPCIITKEKYSNLMPTNEKLLDEMFNKMYTKEDLNQFLYYILCLIDNNNIKQAVFLTIDKSKVGKTSKISCLSNIGLNNIAYANLLKGTELYNLVDTNAVIINEAQSEKDIYGNLINILVDNQPLKVTRKNKSAILIKNKPLLNIMSEAYPHIKGLSDGTIRRFYLVPKVSDDFLKYKDDDNNKIMFDDFYNLLNEEHTEVLQYYIKKIKELNIKENASDIKNSMSITLKELKELAEDKEEILGTYFNLNPNSKSEVKDLKDDNINYSVALIDNKTLDYMLEYIDKNMITVNHYNSIKLAKKHYIQMIKDNLGTSNLKNLGRLTNDGITYYYSYQLTSEGIKLLNEINNINATEDKLTYYIR